MVPISKFSYDLDNLRKFVDLGFNRYLKDNDANLDLTEKEKEKDRKDLLRSYSQEAFAGEEKDREFLKQFIKRFITTPQDLIIEGYPEDYSVTHENIDEFLDLRRQQNIDPYLKFMILIYHLKKIHGKNSFANIIESYKFNRLRRDEHGELGFFISSEDIEKVYESERVHIDFNLKLDILVQLIYEEFKGNSNIDELLYQNIDDIGIGLSGLQNEIIPPHLANKNYPFAYEGCWIKYKGALIHLKFLSLRSFENLKKIVKQGVAYKQKGQFSESQGFKLGYGKDGSRRTAAIEPFGENPALWIRKFSAKDLSNEQLVLGNNEDIEGAQDLLRVEQALIKGGATIPICGPQGAGKTTKLEALCEYIQSFYAIRMIESEFEARIRWRYPNKNIYTIQELEKVDSTRAYEFSLRSSGDIYVISEARSDEMVVNITRTANRGGRSVLFTYHPNKPSATITEVANALLREKLYTTLKDSMYTALETIKCCIQIDIDFEKGRRYYNLYEFVPARLKVQNAFLNLQGEDKKDAFLETMYSFFVKSTNEDYFEAIPILVYDRENEKYQFKNNITDRFFEELYDKSWLMDEKRELEKIFRPGKYLRRYIQKEKKDPKSIDKKDFDELCESLKLNTQFISFDSFKKACDNNE